MPPRGSLSIENVSEIRFRIDSIGAGARLLYAVFGAGITYTAATWHLDNRPLIAALFVGLAICGLAVSRLPADRIVRSRRGEALFLAWSILWIAITGALVAVDGGGESPLVVLFFLPPVFAALSYPLPSVVAIGALSELTLVGVIGTQQSAEPVQVAFFVAALGMTAVLCAWQAQAQDSRREELALISRADPLTGSLNRRGFEERLNAELDESLRTGRPVAVVMLDLDNFKQVNDTRGHGAGDELLRSTVEAMNDTVRPMDSVGRLGGDEFILLLPGTGQAEALEVAARVREAVATHIDVATGVACFPAHGIGAEELLRHADQELYAAKEGRSLEHMPGRRELSWAAALARAVDLRIRTSVSDEHSDRVSRYAAAIGERLGWGGPELALLRMAAMLHDIGKVSLPDGILSKTGQLSAAEYEQVKTHPTAGAELVSSVDGLEPILPWIRHSHEHFDGSGYPDGLSGEAIPPASRILLVADAFDAMTSGRPYRPAVPVDAALGELLRCAGRQFDPRCVEALDSHIREAAATV